MLLVALPLLAFSSIGASWRCDSPTQATYIDGEHWDRATVTDLDRWCETTQICIGWSEPADVYWWHEEYYVQIGGVWWVDTGIGQWLSYSCGVWSGCGDGSVAPRG
jgi:hypothetical protein